MLVTVPTLRVILADKLHLMRRAIAKMLLSKAPDIAVWEASNCLELLLACAQHKPDLVLIDLRMVTTNDAWAIKFLLRGSNFLAMSTCIDEETAQIADSYGALRLLDKADLGHTLLPAIDDCARNRLKILSV
jgi:DNA-binding NarL/FixJ family response regulator